MRKLVHETLLRFQGDIRQAIRQFLRRPASVLGVVVTLGLGVFGTAALARAVVETAFRPPPGAALDGLYAITDFNQRTGARTLQIARSRIDELRRGIPETVATVAIDAGIWQASVENGDRLGTFPIGLVDGHYATSLQLRAAEGRWIAPDDDRLGSAVAVIASSFRDTWFADHPGNAIGAVVRINGRPFTIIGVAGHEFGGLMPGLNSPTAWVPLGAGRMIAAEGTLTGLAFARPRAGVSISQLAATVRTAGGSGDYEETRIGVVPLVDVIRDEAGVGRAILLAAMATLLWLTCCSSVGNLFLAQASARRPEVSVRRALGASRAAIVQMFCADALVVAVLAVVFGGALTSGLWWLLRSRAPGLAGVGEVSAQAWFAWLIPAVAATVVSTVVVAAIAARLVTRATTATCLSDARGGIAGGPRLSQARVVLVALQVAIALQAALGVGLYVERLSAVRRQAPVPTPDAFDAAMLTTAGMDLVAAGYDAPRAHTFVTNLVRELVRLPGVQAAAVASGLPSSEPGKSYVSVTSEDVLRTARTRLAFRQIAVTPSFFDTLGIRIIQGTPFADSIDAGPASIAIVSQSGAAALWPGRGSVTGRKLLLPRFHPESRQQGYDELTVVGVASDSVRRSAVSPPWAANVMFVPLKGSEGTLVITRSNDPASLVEPIRRAVKAQDAGVVLFDASVRANREQLRLAALNRLDTAMAGVSALAILVSTIGVYGLMSFFAEARRGELAVRAALGASPRSLAEMMMRQGVRIILFGLLPGVFVASALARLLQARVLDFMPNDVTTWVASVGLVLVAGLAASYVPARRAASEDPALRLRHL